MDIKVLDDKGQEVAQEEKTVQANYGQTMPDGQIMLEQIGQLFDFKPSEVNSYKTELNTLIEFAKLKSEDHSVEGLKWALTDLGIKLGTPPMGEKRIKQMTRYAYLYMETLKNKQLLDKMVKGDIDLDDDN